MRLRRGEMAEAVEHARADGRPPRPAEVVALAPGLDALADDLARKLADEPLGLSLSVLALRVRRRHSVVRQVLRADPRFGAEGVTRGRRWYLHEALGGSRAGMGRDSECDPRENLTRTEIAS